MTWLIATAASFASAAIGAFVVQIGFRPVLAPAPLRTPSADRMLVYRRRRARRSRR